MTVSGSLEANIAEQGKVKFPRLASLDIFRGLSVAIMIFVNMVGTGLYFTKDKDGLGIFQNIYLSIDHAKWDNSWNLADFAFPFFLYISGMAMAFSGAQQLMDNRSSRQTAGVSEFDEQVVDRTLVKSGLKLTYLKILRRTALLLLIGVLINGLFFKLPDVTLYFSKVRYTGVLQRIALTGAAASLIVLWFPNRKTQWGIAAAILVGYCGLMLSFGNQNYVPLAACSYTPDAVPVVTDMGENLAAHIDRLLIPVCHAYGLGVDGFDPEGIFSSFPAIVSVLLGYFNGVWIVEVWQRQLYQFKPENSMKMTLFGLAAIIISILWNVFQPINKILWSSSFVLFMVGWALLIYALIFELIEVRQVAKVVVVGNKIDAQGVAKMVILPLAWMGKNALFAYVVSVLMIRLMKSPEFVKGSNFYQFLERSLFGWTGGGAIALFALVKVLLFVGICYLMYRKSWFVKL
jgi:predicted acyltransferase